MSEVLASGRFVRLVREGMWEWAERVRANGVVVIAALTDDREVVLVEQHRIPVGRSVIELPAGLAGDVAGAEAEGLEAAAARELEEETGYRTGRLERLTAGAVGVGMTDKIGTDLVRAGNVASFAAPAPAPKKKKGLK